MDRELRAFLTRSLSDPRHAAAIAAAHAQVADRPTALNTDIAECEALAEALADRLGRREMTLAAFDKANQPRTADLTRLRAERDTLTTGQPAQPVHVQDATTLGAQWNNAEAPDRRTMLLAALGPLRLIIDPAPPGGRQVFDPARVRIADPQTTRSG